MKTFNGSELGRAGYKTHTCTIPQFETNSPSSRPFTRATQTTQRKPDTQAVANKRTKLPVEAFAQPLRPQDEDLASSSGLIVERWNLFTDGGDQGLTPTLIIKPREPSGPRPCVIMLHGTGSDKESCVGEMVKYAQTMGAVTCSVDARYHGDRDPWKDRTGAARAGAYNEAMVKAYRGESDERPFLLDTTWDLLGVLDYLCGRPDVDQRIAMTGISLGGMHTWLTAVLDTRVKVAGVFLRSLYTAHRTSPARKVLYTTLYSLKPQPKYSPSNRHPELHLGAGERFFPSAL